VTTPDVGDLFQYKGNGFRVTGWIRMVKRTPLPTNTGDATRDLGNRVFNELLTEQGVFDQPPSEQWCLPEVATHVTGAGVCGCIAPITDITIDGRVTWPEDYITQDRKRALALGAEGSWVW
jgi:hypothetical protein